MVSAALVIDLVTVITLILSIVRLYGGGLGNVVVGIFLKYPVGDLLVFLVLYQTGTVDPLAITIGILAVGFLVASYWTSKDNDYGGPIICIPVVFLLYAVILLTDLPEIDWEAIADALIRAASLAIPYAIMLMLLIYASAFVLGTVHVNPEYMRWESERPVFMNPNNPDARRWASMHPRPRKYTLKHGRWRRGPVSDEDLHGKQ